MVDGRCGKVLVDICSEKKGNLEYSDTLGYQHQKHLIYSCTSFKGRPLKHPSHTPAPSSLEASETCPPNFHGSDLSPLRPARPPQIHTPTPPATPMPTRTPPTGAPSRRLPPPRRVIPTLPPRVLPRTLPLNSDRVSTRLITVPSRMSLRTRAGDIPRHRWRRREGSGWCRF